MYGFEEPPLELVLAIAKKMREVGLEKEVVITIIHGSLVYSCSPAVSVSPFLRICATDDDEIKKVSYILKEMKIGIDVETFLLHGFVSASEMK